MTTKAVTDATFADDVLGSPIPVLVDFWAEWCTPCKMIAPALEDMASQLAGKVAVVKINIDENPATPSQFGVQAIPTLILFKNGKVADRRMGAMPKTQLNQWIGGAVA